jgi:hypothetical protein
VGIRLFVEVLEHAPDTLTWRERYALAVLAENANDSTRECWPGIEDDPAIAHRMRLPGRSSRYDVLSALRKKGALMTVTSGHRGRRAVYRVPVMRPETPDAIDPAKGPGTPDKGSGNPGPNQDSKGPETPDPMDAKGSGNEGERVQEPREKGPETQDPFPSVPSTTTPSASKQEEPAPDRLGYGIPEAARPLVDQLTAAGVIVRWPFTGNAWFPVLALIEKTGVPALVEYAVRAAARTNVDSAKYFMRGWSELPPLPAPGAVRPPLRAVSGDWQPYSNPTDHSVYENGF